MRTLKKCLIFAFVLSALTFSSSAQQSSNQNQEKSLIEEAISITANLKEGNIRSEVERDFVMDGGLQTRDSTRYIFRKCHLIKITVEYSLDEKAGSWIDGSPNNRVISVSKPFLEYPNAD